MVAMSKAKKSAAAKKAAKKRTDIDDHDISIQKVDKGKKRKASVSMVIEEKKNNILANMYISRYTNV